MTHVKRGVPGACSQARERFYQFLWRPRAPTLLSREAEADLIKRLKEFSKRYDEEDNALLDEVPPPLGPPQDLHLVTHLPCMSC